MPETVFHQMMMLRPMQAGVSGFARVQGEAGRQLVQINLRGLRGGGIRAFWYAGDGLVTELGRSKANPQGEAGLYTDLPQEAVAPRRLTALLITDGEALPRPLAIGLCTTQSAGSLMDARNALLALCDRLGREAAPKEQPKARTDEAADGENAAVAHDAAACTGAAAAEALAGRDADSAGTGAKTACAGAELPVAAGGCCPPAENGRNGSAVHRVGTAVRGRQGEQQARLPREVFLPAIDVCRARRRSRKDGGALVAEAPAAAQSAAGEACVVAASAAATPPSAAPSRRRVPVGAPADRLPMLCWPESFADVAPYFDRCPPVPLLPWKGWRFVEVQKGESGLWIGRQRQHGRIVRIAYALPEHAPVPPGQPFRPFRALGGETVQLLVLRA